MTAAAPLQLANGAITNSRFGLKGDEDLGDGSRAVFRLENGFDPQTGMANQNGRLFGRYAYVGLSNDRWGTLTAGRQGAESFNFFGEFDPLTVGNYMGNSWPFLITVGRLDNLLTYAGKFGGLNLGLTYGFGNQFGSMRRGSYWGARASYDAGPLSFGGTYQEMRDPDDRAQRMWAWARYAGRGQALRRLHGRTRRQRLRRQPAERADAHRRAGLAQRQPART